MFVLVTQNDREYEDFMKVSTLQEAADSVGIIDALIYHDSDEPTITKIKLLESLKPKVLKVVYICSEETLDLAIKMEVTTMAGVTILDEFYMESNEDLFELVNNLNEYSLVEEDGSIDVLLDFTKKFLQNNKTDFTPTYIKNVKLSVQNLIKQINKRDLEMVSMSETATQIYNSIDENMSGIVSENNTLKESVIKLKSLLEERNSDIEAMEDGLNRAPSMVYFPVVNYPKEKKIIRIKELGNVRYLTSFALGLRIYLNTVKNVRPKLIFIMPIGDIYQKQYEGYNWVTQSNLRDKKFYYSDVVFTNCPNKEVITTILDDMNYDFFVVVDRTKNGEKMLLNSKGPLWYALQSKSVLKKFNVKLGMNPFFTSCDFIDKTKFCLMGDMNYPEDKAARERFYINNHRNEYDIITQ